MLLKTEFRVWFLTHSHKVSVFVQYKDAASMDGCIRAWLFLYVYKYEWSKFLTKHLSCAQDLHISYSFMVVIECILSITVYRCSLVVMCLSYGPRHHRSFTMQFFSIQFQIIIHFRTTLSDHWIVYSVWFQIITCGSFLLHQYRSSCHL